jgi:hypothetical protein
MGGNTWGLRHTSFLVMRYLRRGEGRESFCSERSSAARGHEKTAARNGAWQQLTVRHGAGDPVAAAWRAHLDALPRPPSISANRSGRPADDRSGTRESRTQEDAASGARALAPMRTGRAYLPLAVRGLPRVIAGVQREGGQRLQTKHLGNRAPNRRALFFLVLERKVLSEAPRGTKKIFAKSIHAQFHASCGRGLSVERSRMGACKRFVRACAVQNLCSR